jgi:hypothetical protein
MPNKEIKPLRFNKLEKFATKLENEIDTIGNAVAQAVKSFEQQDPYFLMFHLGKIIQLGRDARSEMNSKRLEIRDLRSASFIKRHITGAEIVTPAMKEAIKEEKDQGFKRHNSYYNNRNNYGRRNSFTGYSHNIDSSTYQLAQAIQKLGKVLHKGEKRNY